MQLVPEINYFVDRRCLPTWGIPARRINFHDLTLVYAGKATYFIDHVAYSLGPGDLLYAPKMSMRSATTDPKELMHCWAFNFQCYTPRGADLTLPLPRVKHVGIIPELFNLYEEFNRVWLTKPHGYQLKANALFLLILHKVLYSSTAASDRRISIIKEYLLEHFSEKVDLGQLAQLVQLNPIYLGAYFKKQTGVSIKGYLNQIRIEKAKALLATGGYSVGEVAERCGFNDIFYFSRVFKQIVGVPPSTFLFTATEMSG